MSRVPVSIALKNIKELDGFQNKMNVSEMGTVQSETTKERYKAIKELKDDIKARGLKNPVTVFEIQQGHDEADTQFGIIEGHTRIEATKALGWHEIEAYVLQCSQEEAFDLARKSNHEVVKALSSKQKLQNVWDLHLVGWTNKYREMSARAVYRTYGVHMATVKKMRSVLDSVIKEQQQQQDILDPTKPAEVYEKIKMDWPYWEDTRKAFSGYNKNKEFDRVKIYEMKLQKEFERVDQGYPVTDIDEAKAKQRVLKKAMTKCKVEMKRLKDEMKRNDDF